MIDELIQIVLDDPSEENKEKYKTYINQTEYSMLLEAYEHPEKSQEFFDQKRKAFAYRRDCAKVFLNKWIAKYGTTENSPVSYADTLIIPFQEIKQPK